jgi:hypothetical protein
MRKRARLERRFKPHILRGKYKVMRVEHQRLIDCSGIETSRCSDNCLAALGHGLAFKLRADRKDDTVHGSVTISHALPPTPHYILIEVYEEDSPPSVWHSSHFARPAVMPTVAAIKARLDTL